MGSTSVQLNVKNNCRSGENMSLTDKTIYDGYWDIDPPTSLASGATATFLAKNGSGKTHGYVTYILSDNSTTVTITFDDPHGGDNDGGATLAGGSPNNYIVEETDSSFSHEVSFPLTGNDIQTYWLVEDAS